MSAAAIMSLAGCSNDADSESTYTYNTYLSTSPSTWNVHNWETSDESYITSFTEMGLYDAVLNSTKDGYEFVSEMAGGMPVAVDPNDSEKGLTDEEKDKYYSDIGNVSENMVWDIPLNKAATWEDGTAIKAQDYVDSMELLLNPKYANYRADSYYDGNLILVNAENYYKQGRQTLEEFYKYMNSGTTEGNVKYDTGYYYLNLGKYTSYVADVFSNSDSSTTFYTVLNQYGTASTYGTKMQLACQRIINAYSYYMWKGLDHAGSSHKNEWERIKEPSSVSSSMVADDNVDIEVMDFDKGFTDFSTGETVPFKTIKELNKGWITYKKDAEGNATEEIDTDNTVEYSTNDLKEDLKTVVNTIGRGSGTNKKWSWKVPLFTLVTTYEGDKIEMDDVGIRKIDDYTIRLYLKKAITSLNLKFALTGNWLVKTDLYKSLSRDLGNGSLGTTYASGSVGNYMSYGPYKLTYFEQGKKIVIKRNNKWYGYSDGQHNDQFKMDEVDTMIYTDHKTAMNEFLAGNLDDIDLTVNDVHTYGSSKRATTTYESYTQKLSFNSDRDMLYSRQKDTANSNKTILANTDFRKGLSLGTDRKTFASQATSGSKAFTGLLNDLYLANNSTGQSYRSTAQGQSVYGKVYGHLGGSEINEKTGAALSEDAVGYNHDLAVAYLAKGMKEELNSKEDGHLKAGDTIKLEFRVYDDSSENTVAAYNYLKSSWTGLIADAVAALKKDGALNESESISIDITMQKDQDYYTTAQQGHYDMIFSIWGGAATNPYGLMEVYCKSDFTQTCEYGFKGHQADEYLEIDVNGDDVIDPSTENRSFNQWYDDMNNGDEFNEAKYGDELVKGDKNYDAWLSVHNKKLNVLAGLEAGILNRFEAVPLVARGSTSLLSFKVEYATYTYVSLIGYGGIRFMKFNYTNSQWKEYCSKWSNDLGDLYKAY